MKIKIYFISIAFLIVSFSGIAQQTPANPQKNAISIVGATAHVGNGEILENCLIVFENGIITTMETMGGDTPKGTIIEAKGAHVYPGFIAANSSLGLVEVSSVRASDDEDEIGEFIPHVRSIIAYDAESKIVESMRPNGILMGQIAPKGSRISGMSSIVQFDAWNWEDAVFKENDGVFINWPAEFSRSRRSGQGVRSNSNYQNQLAELSNFLKSAKAYLAGDKHPVNLAFEAMQGVFDGQVNVYVRVNDEKGIVDAVNFKVSNNLLKMVIVGGYHANKQIPLLKKHNIPVLVNHTHMLPSNNDDDLNMPFKLPKLLSDAGILVGIQTGASGNFQTRNLPFYAGQVVGQGLDKEKALQLITLNTAKILGIDSKVGSLEVGKQATLFISKGDALDMRGNSLTHAFIDGREISLETHQTNLWKRYSKKLGQ